MFEKKAANPALPFFTALCMFLSAVEYAVPKPLPFMRLGLANVPLMLAFGFMNFSSVLLLAALKVFVQGVISGTLLSYVFVMSFFGTFLSVIFSFAAYSLFFEKKMISFVGVCIFGALGNVLSQMFWCRIFFFGETARAVWAGIVVWGFAAGIMTGCFTKKFADCSQWYAGLRAGTVRFLRAPVSVNEKKRFKFTDAALWLTSAAGVAGLMFCKNIFVMWGICALFFIAASVRRKKCVRILPGLAVVLFMTAASVFTPYGKVLFSVGSVMVTEGAVTVALMKAARLLGICWISQTVVAKEIYFGTSGHIFSEVIAYFDALTGQKWRLGKKGFFKSLDGILTEVCTNV